MRPLKSKVSEEIVSYETCFVLVQSKQIKKSHCGSNFLWN